MKEKFYNKNGKKLDCAYCANLIECKKNKEPLCKDGIIINLKEKIKKLKGEKNKWKQQKL